MLRIILICIVTLRVTHCHAEPQASIAILVPIHPTKYDFAKRFERSHGLFGKGTDLCFIFTTYNDKIRYHGQRACKCCIVVNVDDKEYTSIVTFKKLFALSIACKSYSYAITMDAETLFVQNITNRKLFEKTIHTKSLQKVIWTSGHDGIDDEWVSDASSAIAKTKQPKSGYTWWNDIPLYTCSHVPYFLEYINFPDSIVKAEWGAFDHVIYQLYLVSKFNYSMQYLPYNFPCNYNEFISRCSINKIVEFIRIVEPMWLAHKAFLKMKSDATAVENVFWVFHVDRDV